MDKKNKTLGREIWENIDTLYINNIWKRSTIENTKTRATDHVTKYFNYWPKLVWRPLYLKCVKLHGTDYLLYYYWTEYVCSKLVAIFQNHSDI